MQMQRNAYANANANAMRCDAMQGNATQCNAMQCNALQCINRAQKGRPRVGYHDIAMPHIDEEGK
eukprot:1092371-Lingulodinium_polyedra.AAC.1